MERDKETKNKTGEQKCKMEKMEQPREKEGGWN